ncbi:MAG TPA: sulfatase-like hydrolase/transferase [Vicinamibacterales bacterium]
MIALVAGVLLPIVAIVLWFRGPRSEPPAPIILISIDTLRADHLPAYGYTKVKTPAIDALAADGVLFEHAYAHSPQTLPSHAAILTGQLPFETGVRDNIGFTLRDDQPTLAAMLRDRGYATGGVVSAFVLRKETGIARGFDFFDGDMPPAAPDMPMGMVQRSGSDSLGVAERWMQNLSSSRFFLFFHVYDPHTPYSPPERFARYAPYDGEIAYTDEVVGQLVAWLKARGWYDPALIVFLSDHGEGLGDHGELEHGLFLYDSTIRVPLIVKMPGGAARGRRIPVPVQHIDLVPTVLDWLGIAPSRSLRGRSLRPLLAGSHSMPAEGGFYAEAFYGRYHFGWSELYSLTDARFRFIKAPHPELYDLQNDRGETRNLAAARPQVVTATRAALDRLLAGAKVQAPGIVSNEDLERLQALGYVGTHATIPLDSPGDSLPDPKDKAPTLEKFRKAITASASRDYDQSILLMREVLADSPTMKDGWLQLGVSLVRSGRLSEALDAFKRLVEADPADANSFVSTGGVLLSLGRLGEAQANAEMALSKSLASDRRAKTSAYELLVKVALERKDLGAARRAATLSQQADPAFPLQSFVEGAILHSSREFEQALPRFQDTARRVQGQAFAIPELYFYLGDTFANLGREEEAIAAFREELRLFPLNARARTSLAMLYRAGGRNADAEREIDALVRSVPTPEGYAMAAKTWSIFGETGRANAVRAEAARRFAKK